MGYIGSRKGPPKSEVIWNLGADFFGIDHHRFIEEIEALIEEEENGEIDPIYQNISGDFFLFFLVDKKPRAVSVEEIGLKIDFQPEKTIRFDSESQ